MEEIQCLHAIVEGRVQGVGFRVFTEEHARNKELRGWVRNRPDGTVEVEAEGPKLVLEDFLVMLHEGPPLAHVTQIVVDWKAANRQSNEFTVRLN